MLEILTAIIILIQLIVWVIVAHIILSWLQVFGLNIKIKFIDQIITPIYKQIESVIPTTFGPFTFTPIIVLLILMFIKGAIYILFPTLPYFVPQLFR